MALRKILTKEDPMLRKKCREVTEFKRRTVQLVEDLLETVVDAFGLGLAAPQVGVLRRVVVVHDGEKFIELINPVITSREGEIIRTEACLSCPDEMGIVRRPQKVTVKAQDRSGAWFERSFEDMAARAVCHELDHLDGVLYIDIAEHMLSDEELERLESSDEKEQE